MIINLSEIMSVKGKIEQISAPIELMNFLIEGEEYSFSSKSLVELEITNLGERKVRIEGNAEVSLIIPCSRCLDPVNTFFKIEFDKELDLNYKEEDRIKELDETNYINGYHLDVDLLVYDEIFIDFPMKVLCDADCKGFCKVCGTNLNKSSCNCENPDLDPRMSVIRDIFSNFKEV